VTRELIGNRVVPESEDFGGRELRRGRRGANARGSRTSTCHRHRENGNLPPGLGLALTSEREESANVACEDLLGHPLEKDEIIPRHIRKEDPGVSGWRRRQVSREIVKWRKSEVRKREGASRAEHTKLTSGPGGVEIAMTWRGR
jgi:hypothetical protein